MALTLQLQKPPYSLGVGRQVKERQPVRALNHPWD